MNQNLVGNLEVSIGVPALVIFPIADILTRLSRKLTFEHAFRPGVFQRR
jgi:hypothetical protein